MLYYVQVLTVGAIETLKEFAMEQAKELIKCAHFKPATEELIEQIVFKRVKQVWKDQAKPEDILFDIPDYVMPVFTIELWTAVNMYVPEPCTGLPSEPIFKINDQYKAISKIDETLRWWPATEPLIEDDVEDDFPELIEREVSDEY